MLITKKSSITGKTNTKSIPVNPEDYIMWTSGILSIEEAMPYLSVEDKEFILAGIDNKEWKEYISRELESIE